jgi:hypothetical protein
MNAENLRLLSEANQEPKPLPRHLQACGSLARKVVEEQGVGE